ncbi:iron chelate uptake ABC transporter family permease subunit [Actinokineospora sp. NBRC 105648]|uniref:FecCD family ABC transporter permease n=1 Tax=Actinokineospora sp. NBRC 105648 TaxID=3032206 RepID=UPI0024A08F46|nr:iron chelate uptake ABC transporter family permease subunit [Actinokineospora sp. NBRC 105648]GLZ42777.1 iron ABC transporter permease [Actinokineospora sp. NBRC 105648]
MPGAPAAVVEGGAPTGKLVRPRAGVRFTGLLVALVALAGVCVASLLVGAQDIDPHTVWRLLLHDDGSETAYIVRELRVPRTLVGLLVGAALGLAGALMQALTRNPLADPGLLGVEIGASTAVVLAISLLGVTAPAGYVWFALAGAGATSVFVYVLGAAGRAATPERMVLAGAAITAALGALVGTVLVLDAQTFDQFRFWVIGSLAGRGMDVFWQVSPFIAVGLGIALLLGRPLNALALGDEAGRALGARIGETRLVGALAVTLLSGAATAAVGPVGFVGLTVPHVARAITGPDHRWVLPYSAVLAPILVLGADVVGRVVGSPGELQVGIVMVLIGGPVFIVLCRRRRIAQL